MDPSVRPINIHKNALRVAVGSLFFFGGPVLCQLGIAHSHGAANHGPFRCGAWGCTFRAAGWVDVLPPLFRMGGTKSRQQKGFAYRYIGIQLRPGKPGVGQKYISTGYLPVMLWLRKQYG